MQTANWIMNYMNLEHEKLLRLKDAHQSIKLSAIKPHLIDALILALTNEYRRIRGVHPLSFAPTLRASSHLHSLAMKRHNFFDHVNPYNLNYKTIDKRVIATGVGFERFGENLAKIPTIDKVLEIGRFRFPEPRQVSYFDYVSKVITAWIESPGHEKNLVDTDYYYSGSYALLHHEDDAPYFLITQNFGSKISFTV